MVKYFSYTFKVTLKIYWQNKLFINLNIKSHNSFLYKFLTFDIFVVILKLLTLSL